ncbi:MAG TPA: T9SS type B sorting domain-containing protein, partial [Flavobacterium sp.]|nr:T9SS type B sorting domain-containing protein [Flavobacterium sp.]
VITNVAVNDLSDSNSIIVTVAGQGSYVYSIDGIAYQASNVFTNLAPGTYTVFVKDLNGCGTSIKEVNVLGIPKYFTPNGDGFNDFWNIKGASSIYGAKITISIFDRYGKFLKQISPLSAGWDGTFNQQRLPSTDYWYTIRFDDGRIVKGHFALKR